MPINLRELATLHRPGQLVDYNQGTPAIPEFNRVFWCMIDRSPENDLRVVCRYSDLRGIAAVIGTTTRQGSDFSVKFSDDLKYRVLSLRPFEGNPRQYAEIRVSAISTQLPFSGDLE